MSYLPETLGIVDLLRFYAEAGYDDAIEEFPVNRLQEQPERTRPPTRVDTKDAPERPKLERRPAPAAAPAPAQRGEARMPDEEQVLRARAMAREARTLDELRDMLAGFDGCNLKLTAKNTVFADGDPAGGLMLVGEAPGRDEDIEGLPFVGRSGQLLDRILAAMGRDRTQAYIANVIPWRPPGNRDPSPLETEICRPFIERQIELANPKVLVTLGNPSTKLLLKAQAGIMRLRGTWLTYVSPSGLEIPAMPTLHPAYLLRNPAHKKFAWRDFLEVKARLEAVGGPTRP